ncbi:MAG: FAD-binding protein [Bacteroidales bacterium]|nr:FAD-binding protein [Bacteroidales bacterium]
MNFDIVIIGGGWTGCSLAGRLCAAGMKVCVVSDGLSLSESASPSPYARLAALQSKGAVILRGDRAEGGIWDGSGLLAIYTRNLGNGTPLYASDFILATGKFFSRGLLSDKLHVWEPVFGSDVLSAGDRTDWFKEGFSERQPFMDFGVRTDAYGRILFGGVPALNLYAAGDIVAAGFDECDLDYLLDHAGKE